MSRHWRPGNREDWTVIDGYGAPERRVRVGAVVLVLGVIFLGLLGGAAWQRWHAPTVDSGPSGPIEWNEVQAVPTRAPDAQDVAWEERAGESPVIASGSDAIQTGLPRASSARNDIGAKHH
jgi:hypothetical protein